MKAVTIAIELPDELAAEAEALHLERPSFLAHIVEYALTRYFVATAQRRRELEEEEADRPRHAAIIEEDYARERRILEEALPPEPLHAHLRAHDPASRP
jgi:hypothetical protein